MPRFFPASCLAGNPNLILEMSSSDTLRSFLRQGTHFVKSTNQTLLALVAIAVTVGALWFTNGAVAPKQSTWADVVTEAQQGGYNLISTDDLFERFSEDRNSLLLVDTRQDWEYRSGHIQGAVNFPMEPTWFARWRKKPDLGKLLGPDKQRLVVFY